MQVSEVMTREVECTRPNATIQQVAERMRNLDVGALPICENDRLVGIVTDRDIAVRANARGDNPMMTSVSDIMTPTVVYCFEDQEINEAARLMREKQIRRLPVLSRDKHLVGIVSLGDLAVNTGNGELAGQTLEAISEPCGPRR